MELPFVLAGPILRRVEPRAVAVWVALSQPATVTLSVWEGLRKSGTTVKAISVSPATATLRIGTQLHVALVVLRRPAPAVALQPGVNYAYDLSFDLGAGQPQRSLASEGLLGRFAAAGLPPSAWVSEAPLGYTAGFLPSFALPPALLTDLNVLYGSCRRVANDHYDAMPWIDTLVEQAFAGQTRQEGDPLGPAALKRPHQLYLGGDQIYADDVSAPHLTLLNRLGHRLLSGSESPTAPKVELLQASGRRLKASATVPESLLIGRAPVQSGDQLDLKPAAFPATLDNFPPGGRLELTLADARFTSSDGSSHLLSFGEFAAMYLTVYADWCWDGLKELSLDAVARSPAKADIDAAPMYARSRLDDASVDYFAGSRWSAWNDIRPRPDKTTGVLGPRNRRRLADCFAHFMLQRLARPDGPTGHAGFLALIGDPDSLAVLSPEQRADLDPDVARAMEELARKHAVVVRTFMGQLQARVMRALVRRFGIARVADVDCVIDKNVQPPQLVLLAGPTAILAELRKRGQLYDDKQEDRWCQHLQTLVPAAQWTDFLRDSLRVAEAKPWLAPEVPTLTDVAKPEPADVADMALEPALLERLVTGWADDPAPDQRKAFADDGYANLSQTMLARCLAEFAGEQVWPVWRGLHGELAQLRLFAAGQPKVRRALANVPTYMVFDDHDVTDDWNLNPEWCRRVLAADATRTQPLGRQVVRNALAAYALFQDWGNDLVRYESGAPGRLVLNQVVRLFGAGAPAWPLPAATRELDRLFGLDLLPLPVDPARPHGRHAPVNAPMKWHYTVDGSAFQVAVLDNRTRRSFAARFGPPGNVAATMIDDQVPAAPLPAGREVLLVVAPLQVLAPSVFDEVVAPGAYRAFDLSTPGQIGPGRGGEGMPGLNPDAIESWALDPLSFEALTARLAPHRQVVLLSGDVHYSAATQMSYWRRGDAQPARLLQFTSSGFKNVMPSYITLIDHSLAFAQELVRSDIGGDRLGWLDGADGAFTFPAGRSERDVPIVLRKRIPQRPAFLPTHGWPAGTRVRSDKRPDFSWTLRPVFDVRPDTDPAPPGVTPRPAMARPTPIAGGAPGRSQFEAGSDSARDAYAQVAARHVRQLDRLSHSRQILFRSNLGRVRFVRRSEGSGSARREVLEAVHQVICALPDPLDGAEQPHLLPPEVVMEQRAELTPPAGAVRPEDEPLKSPLGESVVDKLRALGG